MMNPKYYFALPDLHRPVGGQTIQYRIVEILREAGYDVSLLHEHRYHCYPYFETLSQSHYSPDLANLNRPSVLQNLRHLKSEGLKNRQRLKAQKPHPVLKRTPRDVFVLPEFIYDKYARIFPGAPLILAAQDVFGLARAYSRDMASGEPAQHPQFSEVYVTSSASREAVRTLLDREPRMIGLPIDGEALRAGPKKFQIAYMPRKMKEESDLVLAGLRQQSALADVPIVPIVDMSDEDRDKTLRESLMFLSFSEREGFGLPPAEAMAAECIIIGYTGVGGNEYFTPKTGFPVQSNDIIGFIQTVDRVIRDYRRDPGPLDTLRRNASAHIRDSYKPEVWRATVLSAWGAFDRNMRDLLTS